MVWEGWEYGILVIKFFMAVIAIEGHFRELWHETLTQNFMVPPPPSFLCNRR